MGLAGPRNRRKLDYDPNNTKWTRDETTFGQKILRSQGWEPGKYLGAQDSGHAQLHSAASLAPIKVNLKDDTLGLGAKIKQRQSDECTGLDVFKDLLGRLNGKSEETLQKERQVRSEIKTHLFVEKKYGPMRFVSGGLLVGDQIKMAELIDQKSTSTPIKEESESEAAEVKSVRKEKKDKKDKKRKASESEEADSSDNKHEKKRKRSSKSEADSDNDDTEVEKSSKRKKEKKDKKERKEKRSKKSSEEGEAEPNGTETKRKKSKKSKDTQNQDSRSDGSTENSEDAAEKSRKEKKKDKKRKRSSDTEASVEATTTATSLASTPQDSGTSTPRSTGMPIRQTLSARHLARSRNIASKKLAFSDLQALNQIFMIKPV